MASTGGFLFSSPEPILQAFEAVLGPCPTPQLDADSHVFTYRAEKGKRAVEKVFADLRAIAAARKGN